MNTEQFTALMKPVAEAIAGKPVDKALEDALNARFPADGAAFAAIEAACRDAIAAGWMCREGEGNRRFGRVIEPGPTTHDLSVDVVDMTDLRGGHHKHPNGEILMIMPQDDGAQFDRRGKGWLVYGPGTAHRPTVRGGRALVLYLLPEGKIEWTGT
jgi:Xaa-Pro aminopeptidase